jgi:hypothetical protein
MCRSLNYASMSLCFFHIFNALQFYFLKITFLSSTVFNTGGHFFLNNNKCHKKTVHDISVIDWESQSVFECKSLNCTSLSKENPQIVPYCLKNLLKFYLIVEVKIYAVTHTLYLEGI